LVWTTLKGVYSSNQATASAYAPNAMRLMRGMVGRLGATVFLMNDQPHAEKRDETNGDEEMPAEFNLAYKTHVEELA
jgi:ferredoxin-nitrate reductase